MKRLAKALQKQSDAQDVVDSYSNSEFFKEGSTDAIQIMNRFKDTLKQATEEVRKIQEA